MKSGYRVGAALTGPIVQNLPEITGAHGFLPNLHPELRSSFFIIGTTARAGKNLGIVDMRQIAPTFASLLGVLLPTAHVTPLDLR